MDYELIFWVTAPFVLFALLVVRELWLDWKEEAERRWNKEHADDFNKDLWED